jgi:hypothetical protein
MTRIASVHAIHDAYLGRKLGDVIVLHALKQADPRRAGINKGGEKGG